MQEPLFQRIKDFLDSNQVSYRTVQHEPTHTSEESAKARGESIEIGGKAIVMKVGEDYKLFVLSAALKIDSAAIKAHFNEKRIRFATSEELLRLTGAVPGAVPPFGQPILPLELFLDNSILKNQKIAFNAGSLTDSIIMKVDDYTRVAGATIFDFAVKA